jgi:microtubule-associated protein-like 6
LITGDTEGNVSIHDFSTLDINAKGDPKHLGSFNLKDLDLVDILSTQVQSISIAPEANNDPVITAGVGVKMTLIISTRSCEIMVVDVSDDGSGKLTAKLGEKNGLAGGERSVLVRGHCNGELWGVSTHPSQDKYCSVGDDKTLRFFSVSENRQIGPLVKLPAIARTCCYDSTGTMIAIGFGGRLGRGKEAGGGIVGLYGCLDSAGNETETWSRLAEAKDARQWISDVKFSSDDRTLVAGAHDCKIYIYTVKKDGKGGAKLSLRKNIFAKHSSVINHIDLSADGRYMQSNCSAYELLFSDTINGKQITHGSELRDVKWDTWTCTLGWPVQGTVSSRSFIPPLLSSDHLPDVVVSFCLDYSIF